MKSWATVFSDEIFPAIDEDRFRVLYSETASRPNTPVNVIVGALIIKELFDLSDDEVVENLMLDVHYQYALHTTSYEEQPLSDKTLSRFRRRCYEYERLNGVDLFHDCVCDLSGKIAKMMGISSRIKRMDSLMISLCWFARQRAGGGAFPDLPRPHGRSGLNPGVEAAPQRNGASSPFEWIGFHYGQK